MTLYHCSQLFCKTFKTLEMNVTFIKPFIYSMIYFERKLPAEFRKVC